MTPCEKLGYKAGDKFVVVKITPRCMVEVGGILELKYDDGTDTPYFSVRFDIARSLPLQNVAKLDGDGWIGWKSGEMPVELGTLVDVVYRDGGNLHHLESACSLRWGHNEASGDIVAYRLHQPQQQSGQTLNITDWRDLKPGDIVWWSGDGDNKAGEYRCTETRESSNIVLLRSGSPYAVFIDTVDEHQQWRFIRRPDAVPTEQPNKYSRTVKGISVDVYDILLAWNVTNPALQHLIKKALQCGERGHKSRSEDLNDILESAKRAKELG